MMFRSSNSNFFVKHKLLYKHLNLLNLIYQNGPSNQRTTTTRITPRGPRRRPIEVFKMIYWHKSKMYPPNWKNDHHIFYPTLKEVLLKKHLDEYNKLNYINIGEEYVKQEDKKGTYKTNNLILEKLTSKQDLLNLIDSKSANIEFNYELYNQCWLRGANCINETINLARHYNLFESLFGIDKPRAKPPKKVDFGDLFPRPEQIYESDIAKYYPGAIKFDMNERDNYYYFNPLVPVYCEFVNNDNEISSVIRGNLIEPAFANNKPNIVLDTNYFVKHELNKLYDQFVEDGKVILTAQDNKYYTVALINLDNVFLNQQPICHYLITNIKGDYQEETIKYLPVYGVKGLGYLRYTLVVFRHDEKLNIDKVEDFDLNKRILNVLDFIKKHNDVNLKPVGLSWFQTHWDETCKDFFHNVLKTRMPVYEYIQNKEIKNKQVKIPAPASFNNYLDRYRDPKEISKEVLIERLNKIDPFNCQKSIEDSELPPNIFKIPRQTPSWIKSTMWKRNNRLGKFRGLRAPSALRSHNNNEDLDNPIWPHPDKVDLPMRYPFERRHVKPLKDSKWATPPDQRPSLVVEDHYDVPNLIKEEANKIYKDFTINEKS